MIGTKFYKDNYDIDVYDNELKIEVNEALTKEEIGGIVWDD